MIAACCVLWSGSVPALAVPVNEVTHESTENYFESGGTFVTDCFGEGCSDVSFAIGAISGNVLWEIAEKVFQDMVEVQTTFIYTVFNDLFDAPITSFEVFNRGTQGIGLAPFGWTFSQDDTLWQWQADSPSFGIDAALFLSDFQVDIPGLIPVRFNPTSVDLGDGSVVSGLDWRASAPAPEPATLLLLSTALLGLCIYRRRTGSDIGERRRTCGGHQDADASARRGTLPFVILVACTALPTIGAAITPPIQIIEPPDGAVLSSQTDTGIVAELAPAFQDPSNFAFIQFVVVKSNGTSRFDLGKGDLRLLGYPGTAGAIWHNIPVPGGDYIITASLQDLSGHLFQDSIRVTLNRAPGAQILLLSQQLTSGGALLGFQVDARDVEGDAIVRALWDPGDGSDPVVFTNLNPFTHFYASVPGQTVSYVLTLTVDDARGGQKSVQRDVVLTANSAGQLAVLFEQTHACGCRAMTVFSRTPADAGQVKGTSGVYCEVAGVDPTKLVMYPGCRVLTAQQIEQLPAPARCLQGQVAFACDLGPYGPGDRDVTTANGTVVKRLGFTFEVIANIDRRTNDFGRCTEGQIARGTTKAEGKVVRNTAAARTPPASDVLPFPNPPAGEVVDGRVRIYPTIDDAKTWGADGYTVEAIGKHPKRHIPAARVVRWFDATGIVVEGNPVPPLDDHSAFVAWVTGPTMKDANGKLVEAPDNLGTCWCQFEYDHSWTMAGGRTGPGGAAVPTRVTRLNGVNCTVEGAQQ